MKKIVFLAALIFSITSVNAQWITNKSVSGNGNNITESRNVSGYDKVNLVGSMDVELVSGKAGNLKIEAESNLIEYITTEVDDNELKISVKKGYNLKPSSGKKIKIIVPFENLEAATLTGSGNIWNSNTIKSSKFKILLTGSGDIKLQLDAQEVEGKITGSGDIVLKGKTNLFSCNVTGSGDFKAYDLTAKQVEATVLGSGDIQLHAQESLTAKVMGSGDITYRGNPEKEDFKSQGSGKISKN